MDDIPKQELVENFVCTEIEACLEGDDVQMTNIFNGDTNIDDDVKNVSDIGLLEKSNDCEVKNNVVVEVEELRSMEPSKFSIDLNENFDSSVVCVDSVERDCALPPIDKKNKKEEIIVDYVQSVPSFTSIIQLPPQSQLELVQLPHGRHNKKKGTLRAFQWSKREGIHKTYKDKGHALRSTLWNPKLLLWIFRKQFQKIRCMAYKVWDRGKTCFHKHWWRFQDEFEHKPP
ncbi:hypothetical protein PIB30_095466 [Stylosanthes scabra]|uniref:Uncharacterized protein n=1 Tax=Stylosanthes scabra TaxID=79078 RepID=A0ABU6ZV55_9FABA|nr:hypothetical protein [Stylosanthes scabra]